MTPNTANGTDTLVDYADDAACVLELQRDPRSREAFDALFERYRGIVSSIAMRYVRNATIADDLVQDIFLQAWRKIEQLEDPAAFQGWIRTIARRLSLNSLQRNHVDFQFADMNGDLIDQIVPLEDQIPDTHTQGDPLANVIAAERDGLVQRAVAQIDPEHAIDATLFYFKGMSLKAVADQTKRKSGTVKRRLHTARRRIGSKLRELSPDHAEDIE